MDDHCPMDELRGSGQRKIVWANRHMPVLGEIEARMRHERPFADLRIAVSVHLEAKTARLALALQAGGAEVAVTGSNPLSTQDDVAAALAAGGVTVHARRGVSAAEYEEHLRRVLEIEPHLVLDDGGDLTGLLHGPCMALGGKVLGLCEETTTGVLRLRALARAGSLRFPAVAVNDAPMKRLFDNRHGTGQSVWDAIMRATNLLVAGRVVLVVGYGPCGRGIAERAAGLGGRVLVSEVDPIRAAEAAVDGYQVLPAAEGIREADFVVTATGCREVITWEHIVRAKPGVVLANAGHFDVEIDVADLRRRCGATSARDHVEAFTLPGGTTVYVLAEGRLVNLVAGDGHPVEIMDLSFALQALSLAWLARNATALRPDVYAVPADTNRAVAELFLASIGAGIDVLTDAQRAYLGLASGTNQ